MPTISVIVPVYKVENCLQFCINSILSQSYKDFELILVDDGSPDACGIICDENAKADKRIRVIHKENGGLSSARNAGLRIAKGEYLSFVDSDDLIHPQMLETLINTAMQEDAELVSTRYIQFDNYNFTFDNIESITIETLLRSQFIDNLYPDHFENIGISAWGKLYKRELFSEIKYPEGKIYEDLHIYLKLLRQCNRVVIVKPDMYYYNIDSSSITRSNYLKYNRYDEFVVRLEHADFFRELKNKEQEQFAINDYLTFFFRNYFVVYFYYKSQLWSSFYPHYKKHRKLLWSILQNPKICTMKKLCSVLIHITPRLARRIAKKTIPDCLE